MSQAIFESDIIDDIKSHGRRIAAVERTIGEAIKVVRPSSVSGGYDPGTGTTVPSSIITGSIMSDFLYSGTVQAYRINSTHIASRSIEADRIKSGVITANEIYSGAVQADRIQAGNIASGAIQAIHLSTVSIESGQILVGGQIAGNIATGAIQAGQLAADAINAMTITTTSGGRIRTAAAGARVELGTAIPTSEGNKNGIVGVDGSGNITFLLDSAGNARFKGTLEQGTSGLGNITGSLQSGQIPAGLIGGGNLLPNSSFEHATFTGVTQVNAAIASEAGASNVFHGSKSIKLTAGVGGSAMSSSYRIPVYAGNEYTLTAFVKAGTTPRNVRILLNFYDGPNATGSLTGQANGANTATSLTEWTRTRVSGVAPPNTVSARVYWIYLNSDQVFANEVFYVDAVQLEMGGAPTAYAPKPDEILPGVVGATEIQPITMSASSPNTILVGNILSGTIAAQSIAGDRIVARSVTAVQIATNTITAAELNVLPGGGNIVPNSGFEEYNTGGNESPILWESSGFSRGTTTSLSRNGSRCAVLTCTTPGGNPWIGKRDTTAHRMPVVGGRTYTISAYTRAATTARGWRLYVYWFDGSGTQVGVSSGYTDSSGTFVSGGAVLNSTTEWTRLYLTRPAPATAVTAGILVHFDGSNPTSIPAGEVQYVDSVMMQEGDIPTAYATKSDEILPGTILSTMIGPGEIKTGNIAANSITLGMMQGGSVDGTKIVNGSISTNHLTVTTGGLNFMPDSSFEMRAAGALSAPWTAAGVTTNVVTSGGHIPSNGKYLEVKYASGSNPYVYYRFSGSALTPMLGRKIVVSAYVYRPSASPTPAAGHRIMSVWEGGVSPIAEVRAVDVPVDTWTRIYIPYTVGAGVSQLDINLNSPYSVVGSLYRFDAIKVELGDLATAWSPTMEGTIIDGGNITGAVITGATIQTSEAANATRLTASGLSLSMDNGSGASPVSTSMIQFVRASDAVRQAFIYGNEDYNPVYNSSVNSCLSIGTKAQGGGPNRQNIMLELRAGNETPTLALLGHRSYEEFDGFWLMQVRRPNNHNDRVNAQLYHGPFNPRMDFWRDSNYGISNSVGIPLYAASYNAWSDRAIKSGVKTADVGLKEARKLKPKKFDIKGDEFSKDVLGFVAQDVAKVLPSAVTKSGPNADVLSVDLGQMIALGAQADIELDERIDALEAELAELKKTLETLK